ncbi:MAG: YicC family protein [Clostridia bacterium]|nr:YicC family protein [Clostridia bacterium]
MINSMTAFGRAKHVFETKTLTVEIKSVNNRYLDLTVKLPRSLSYLEEKVRSFISDAGIVRGKVDIFVNLDIAASSDTKFTLDEGAAESYIEALKILRDKFNLPDDISTMRVAARSDLFVCQKPDEDAERDWDELKTAIAEALDEFKKMRANEGERLKNDLLQKKNALAAMVPKIESLCEQSIKVYHDRLHEKLVAVLADNKIEPDEQRILTECAIFADKVAIDEETVRLKSHFESFDGIFAEGGAVGRKLDFLIQEMNREVNTIGSKSNSVEITKIVIAAKSEIEKIREQIQNLE